MTSATPVPGPRPAGRRDRRPAGWLVVWFLPQLVSGGGRLPDRLADRVP